MQQNQDALLHFSKVFWPSLRGTARLQVAGANPSPAITALCAAQGWELYSNVSDAELEALYAAAHYALAPFEYGTGSKLKLIEACARGVPVITTEAGATGLIRHPPYVHVSDKSEQWKRIVQSGPPPAQALRETLDFAKQLSWSNLGAKLARIAEASPVVEI